MRVTPEGIQTPIRLAREHFFSLVARPRERRPDGIAFPHSQSPKRMLPIFRRRFLPFTRPWRNNDRSLAWNFFRSHLFLLAATVLLHARG